MGLDDRIEAKRLEAMPEIVIEETAVISDQNNNGKYFGVGTVVPAGVYVGRTTATMEVLSGKAGTSTLPRCWLRDSKLLFIQLTAASENSGLITGTSSGSSYPGDIFLMWSSRDVTVGSGSSNHGAYVAVDNPQTNSSYEVTGRVELRKLL